MKKLLLTAVMIMSTTVANANVFKKEVISTENVFNVGTEIIGIYNLESLLEDLYYFKANKNLIIHIDVHSDDMPILGYKDNTEFTKARAESLKSALLSTFQDNIKKITTSGKGEFNPVCHEFTVECRAKNRRAVIKVHREDMGRIMMDIVVPTRKNSKYYVEPHVEKIIPKKDRPVPRLGMSTWDVRYDTKFGEPSRISKTESTWGTVEYWYYNHYINGERFSIMLRFENDKLESITKDNY